MTFGQGEGVWATKHTAECPQAGSGTIFRVPEYVRREYIVLPDSFYGPEAGNPGPGCRSTIWRPSRARLYSKHGELHAGQHHLRVLPTVGFVSHEDVQSWEYGHYPRVLADVLLSEGGPWPSTGAQARRISSCLGRMKSARRAGLGYPRRTSARHRLKLAASLGLRFFSTGDHQVTPG